MARPRHHHVAAAAARRNDLGRIYGPVWDEPGLRRDFRVDPAALLERRAFFFVLRKADSVWGSIARDELTVLFHSFTPAGGERQVPPEPMTDDDAA